MRVRIRRLLITSLMVLSVNTVRPQSGIQYVYDDLSRLIAVIDPSGDTATYTYDAVGDILTIDGYASSQVSIISLSPGSGPIGSTVTISGTGFSTTASQNTTTFNGTNATLSSATTTQLVVTVPAGATTGLIAVPAPPGSHQQLDVHDRGGRHPDDSRRRASSVRFSQKTLHQQRTGRFELNARLE